MAYMYQAALYCDSCGEEIQDRLVAANPAAEESDDSETFPQDVGDPGESDSAEHCDSGAACLEFEMLHLSTGNEAIGALLSDRLTSKGEEWVREILSKRRKTEREEALAELYRDHFSVEEKPQPILRVEVDGEDCDLRGGYPEPGEEVSVRIVNPDAEEGTGETAGPLDWFNSARITADPDEDAVHFVLSIDDPRGGLCFTVRRITGGERAGEIIIHCPHPDGTMQHVDVRQDHPGTLVITDRDGKPRRF